MNQVRRVGHGGFNPFFGIISESVGPLPGHGGTWASYASSTEMSFAASSPAKTRLDALKRRVTGASRATVDHRAASASASAWRGWGKPQ
jgi:hypothetical protein